MARTTKLSALLGALIGPGDNQKSAPAVAAALGVSPTAVWAWLAGEYGPAPERYPDLARELGVSPSVLALAAAGLDHEAEGVGA